MELRHKCHDPIESMGPLDRPLRGHRGTSLIFLGIGSSTTPQRRRPNPNSRSELLTHQFNRIDVLSAFNINDTRELGYVAHDSFQLIEIGYGECEGIARSTVIASSTVGLNNTEFLGAKYLANYCQ
jgi:hypothetical protein